MRIAIPSYKRAETLEKKTLNFLLNDCNFPAGIIDVFVADEHEYADYMHLIEKYEIKIIVGVPTLCAQRNFITSYYDAGQEVLCVDDDVEGIYKLNGKKTELFTDIHSLCDEGFAMCKKAGTKLWGIGAVNNHFFMKDNVSGNLKYIVGCFWGYIVDKSPSLTITLEDKEDFERTIKYFDRFKAVVRFNAYAPKTAYYKEAGGMQETRTEQRVSDSAYFLIKKYPQYCTLNTAKKSAHVEIRLKNTAK